MSPLENPLPIWLGGAVLATLAGIVFLARRNLASLATLAGVVLLTLLAAAVERLIVTPREQVEGAVAAALGAIQANDLPAVLALIDPAATAVQADASAAMPQIDVQRAGIEGRLEIEFAPGGEPARATAKFRGLLIGNARRGGATVGFRDQVEIDWVRRGEAWLIDDYRVFDNGRPIDAVGRARR
ncbi:MAG: hypothetical protein KF688_00275 [Pirellulales bacterium]|nr:hypothetical protein [Pirellulales bacterium]